MLYQLTERWDEIRRQVVENREIASIFIRGQADPDELDDVERAIYESRIGIHFNVYFMFYRMAETGYLDEDILEFSDRNFLKGWGATKGARTFWEAYRTLWPDALREHVDALLREDSQAGS